MKVERLYRADIQVYENWSGQFCEVFMREYRVIKETPCGVWVQCWDRTRFVNLKLFRKWAWPTKEEAMASLLARKRRQQLLLT